MADETARKSEKAGSEGTSVLVRRPFAPYGCDGEQVIAQPVRLLQSPAFAEEERRLGAYGREEVHDGGRIGASHAEVDDRNPVGRRIGHRPFRGQDGYAIMRREALHVGCEVRQQHMPREIFQPPLRIAGQPILYNFLFRLHASAFFARNKGTQSLPVRQTNPAFFIFDGHFIAFQTSTNIHNNLQTNKLTQYLLLPRMTMNNENKKNAFRWRRRQRRSKVIYNNIYNIYTISIIYYIYYYIYYSNYFSTPAARCHPKAKFLISLFIVIVIVEGHSG